MLSSIFSDPIVQGVINVSADILASIHVSWSLQSLRQQADLLFFSAITKIPLQFRQSSGVFWAERAQLGTTISLSEIVQFATKNFSITAFFVTLFVALTTLEHVNREGEILPAESIPLVRTWSIFGSA